MCVDTIASTTTGRLAHVRFLSRAAVDFVGESSVLDWRFESSVGADSNVICPLNRRTAACALIFFCFLLLIPRILHQSQGARGGRMTCRLPLSLHSPTLLIGSSD